MGTGLYARFGTGYQITIIIYPFRYRVPDHVKYSFIGSVVRYQNLLFDIFYLVRYWVPDFIPDPVLGTRSYVFLSDPVLGAGSQLVFIYTRSGTGYRIMISILLPGLLSCTRSCILYSLLYPVLGTGLDARSGTGYRILCFYFFIFLDPALGNGSQSVFINTGSGTEYRILLSIPYTGSAV